MDDLKAQKYFNLAEYIATNFSKDPNTRVGCLLIAPDSLQILATGFNGFPRKIHELPERWQRPDKYMYVSHAESNAIANAARSGVATAGSIAVVTLYPCCDCCKLLIQSGIRTLITRRPDLTDDRWGSQFRLSTHMLS